jgi:hypothetical protein
VDPEDRVDRCAGRLFGKDVVMLVCAHCVEREEGHEEQAVGVPAHYGRELRRMYGELERTAAGCALSHNLGPTMSGAVLMYLPFVRTGKTPSFGSCVHVLSHSHHMAPRQ